VVVNALHQHAKKLEEYLDENVWKVWLDICTNSNQNDPIQKNYQPSNFEY
jgi:hypothetical protein